MLFGKKNKKKAVPAADKGPTELWNKTFTQSATFRGYRRVKLSRYFGEEVDKSMAYFVKSNYDMKGRTVQLICTRFDSQRKDGCRIDAYVDGKLLGSVWQSDEKQWPMLTEYDFDKVYVRVDDTWPDCPPDSPVVHTTAYLFVHYPADAPIKSDGGIISKTQKNRSR